MKTLPWRPWLLAVWMLALILIFNTNFGVLNTTAGQMKANDVADIVDGFHQMPHFWSDFGRWWHGPWIESGVQVFRPISSMMLWWECAIGLSYGFTYIAWWGVFLFAVASGLSVCIAWRITKSWISSGVAATLLPLLRFWNWAGTTPDSWAAWMPVHHDLLMIIGLLAAFLAFDWWLETGDRRALIGCWAAFIVGTLSKEYVYIFPLIALLWGLGVSAIEREKTITHAQILRVVGSIFAFTVALFVYRWAVLPAPYNPPPLRWIHIIRRPLLYWFGPFYPYVLPGIWWFVAQAITMLILVGVWLRAWKHKARVWPTLPTFAAILATIILPFLVGWPLGNSPAEAFWYFADISGTARIGQLLAMILTAWTLWLVFKYRRQSPSVAALLILMAIYLPVFTYLGWHYTLTGAFIRGAIWWPVIVNLAMRDIAGWLPAKFSASDAAKRAIVENKAEQMVIIPTV